MYLYLPISSPKANVISFVCPSDISPKYCLNIFKNFKLLESESGMTYYQYIFLTQIWFGECNY